MNPAGADDPTYLVAYDGSDPAGAALQRGAAFANRADARLVVVSVLPTDAELAATYGLVEDGTYEPDAAAERLQAAVEAAAPGATFRAERVDAYAGKRRIADAIARVARETCADVVLLGSEDPGRVVRPVARVDDEDGGDVGEQVDDEDSGDAGGDTTDYDVLVVRPA